jgi:hypothetical protein
MSFTPRPLYPRYPLDRKLNGPQARSGRGGEEKNSLLLIQCVTVKVKVHGDGTRHVDVWNRAEILEKKLISVTSLNL